MGTHYKGTAEEVCALNAYIKLTRAVESVNARLNRRLTDTGLTSPQFNVLEVLFHLGSLSQRDLGAKLLKSGGNITMVVNNLEKRKLVKRKRKKEDRRIVTVHLTEKGRQFIDEIFRGHVGAIVKEMTILTVEEQEQLGRLCRILGLRERM